MCVCVRDVRHREGRRKEKRKRQSEYVWVSVWVSGHMRRLYSNGVELSLKTFHE